MNRIKELDLQTVQKIAAGEVIERPSSIVKELVENSIDANSNNITIEIKNGGKTFIRITDDGDGIVKEDLSLAFKRHSTSKLTRAEDLYDINSLGFRGEALASISSVTKIKIMTKTEESAAGTEADIEDGIIVSENLVGAPKGTTIIARDLFYNLPVRKDFLKTDLVESNRISDIVYKLALGNPDISFNYIKDDKVILKTNKNTDVKNHIYTILGREISNNLIKVDYEYEGIKIHGYISNNQYYRGNRSHQYIFLNERFIINSDIARVMEQEYKSLIPINRYPVFLLFVDIDPATVDVNIHPTKQEVKFTEEEKILFAFSDMVKYYLHPKIEIPSMSISKVKTKETPNQIPNLFEFIEKENRENDIAENNLEKIAVEVYDCRESEPNHGQIEEEAVTNYVQVDREETEDASHNKIIIENDVQNSIDNLSLIGVAFNTFIIAQDRINSKVFFIDQHAAHERIMYEKYVAEYNSEDVNIQMLLSPIIINLTNEEMENTKENIDIFNKLGFILEEFGNDTIIIRGIPILFGKPKIENLFYDILDNLKTSMASGYETKVERIMKISCVHSVKAGDELDEKEIIALFNRLKNCKQPHTCPHGRPTMLEMTRNHIEKEFLRIM